MLRSKKFVVGLCAAAFLSIGTPSLAQPTAITTPMISTNYSQTCAVDSFGTVTCSGSGLAGAFTVPGDLLPVLKVQTVIFGACVLQVNGTVRCWGDAFAGVQSVPTGLTNVTDIVGNTWHMCAKSGDWVCWGDVSSSAAAIPATAKAVYASWGYNCFIDTLDVLTCVGPGQVSATTLSAPIANVESADVGFYGGCAVLFDHTLSCWGNIPSVPVDLGPVAKIAVAHNAADGATSSAAAAACAVLVSGGVRCWGSNWSSGTAATDLVVPPAMGTDIYSITGTGGAFYVLHQDGSVTAWGDDTMGKLNGSLQFDPVGGSSATAPDAPTGVSAVAGDAQATVSWTAPANDGGDAITGYTVTSSPAGKTCTTTGATSCTVTGLTNGVSYTFTVTATNSTGTSVASASASATPVTVPDAPTGVSAVAGDAQATVSWTAPSNDGGDAVTAYTVTSSTGETCSTAVGVSVDLFSCTVTGLENFTEVTFTVVATNSVGDSVDSDASNAVLPRPAGFQVWVPNALLALGDSTDIYVFGAQDFPSVTVTVGGVAAKYTPDADGTIQLSYTADSKNPYARSGYVRVKATAEWKDSSGVTQKITAMKMINIPRSITAKRVRAFGVFKVASRAVPQGKTLSYQIDGTEVCTADADADGRASCQFEAPESEGEYTLETWIGGTLYTSNVFNVYARGNAVPTPEEPQ